MKLRPFELGLVTVFGTFALAALIILQHYEPGPSDKDKLLASVGAVQIWGTLSQEVMDDLFREIRNEKDEYSYVTYQYIDPKVFDERLTNALADGQGPDAILVSHERLTPLRQRIQPFAYEEFPLRDFRNLYIDGADVYARLDGVYAYPMAVDPLMLYWNRDIMSSEGFLEAPKSWETLVNTMFPRLVRRLDDRTIVRSVVAMGEYGNSQNGFALVSALLHQGGSQMVTEPEVGEYKVRLDVPLSGQSYPLQEAASFYSQFGRPGNPLYSWNRSFTDDRLEFISEDLVFYFGFGSEGPLLERMNPNLNFDIAEIPQGETATIRRTYGRFYGLSLLRASDNPSGTKKVMALLAETVNTERIAVANDMVPPRRSLVAAGSNDTYGRLTYYSASVALGWLSPDKSRADWVFDTMTRDLNENRRFVNDVAVDAVRRLEDQY